MKSIQGVQALRAIAALSVVYHIEAIHYGAFGVDIFFVISGFIIGLVGTDEAPKSFILKRLFRVVPLYWLGTLSIFAIAVIKPAVLGATTASITELAKSLFFIPFVKSDGNVFPDLFLGWTLNYEMFFYVLFSVALTISARYAIPIVTALICAVVATGIAFPIEVQPWQFWTRPILFEFVFGLWILRAWRAGLRVPLPAPVLIGSIAVLLATMFAIDAMDVQRQWLHAVSVYGVLSSLILILILSCEGKVRIPLILLAIGDGSYSLYLLHPYIVIPAQKIMLRLTHSPVLVIALSPLFIGLAIAVALMSYQLVEKPTNRLLRLAFFTKTENEAQGTVTTSRGPAVIAPYLAKESSRNQTNVSADVASGPSGNLL